MSFAVTGKKIGAPLPSSHPNPTKPQPQKGKLPTKPITQKPPPQIKPKPIASSKTSGQKPGKDSTQNKQNLIKIENAIKQAPQQVKIEQTPLQVKKQTEVETSTYQAQIVSPKTEDIWSEAIVRYNHYKEKFPTKNGVLSFTPIEDKYSFGDLFKGNYIPILKRFKTNQEIEPETVGSAVDFTWKVEETVQYRLQIQEDDEEEAKYEKKVYKAPVQGPKCPCKKNQRADEITAQIKQLKPEQYGSALHKQLLEQRDLEDVLFT